MIPEHSKIINSVARQILKPNGLERKGQSRTWHDDHGWFTTVVEFQPHSGGQGTYLNVGVNFHWYLKDYFSFDIGSRESDFLGFITVEQFTPEVEKLANLALEKVLFYRKALPDINTASQLILNHRFTSDDLWGNYHKGIICGLNNNVNELNKYFNNLLAVEPNVFWAEELKVRIRNLKAIASDLMQFRDEIENIIKLTRTLKKLPTVKIEIK